MKKSKTKLLMLFCVIGIICFNLFGTHSEAAIATNEQDKNTVTYVNLNYGEYEDEDIEYEDEDIEYEDVEHDDEDEEIDISVKGCTFVAYIKRNGIISDPPCCTSCGYDEWEKTDLYPDLFMEDKCVVKISIPQTIYAVNGNTHQPKVTARIYGYDCENNYMGKYTIPEKYYTVLYSGDGVKAGNYTATVNFTGIYSGTMSIGYKVSASPMIESKLTIYNGERYVLKINDTIGKVKWKSSNKKVAIVSSRGVVNAKAVGKATITATYKGKKYQCKLTVAHANPSFGAILYDYDTRNNCFIVKIKNNSKKTLTVLSGTTKVLDADYKEFDRDIFLSKSQVIKPGKTKTIKFEVKGSNTWYDCTDFTIYFDIKLDDKKYNVKSNWCNVSKYKSGSKWKNSYPNRDWFETFRMDVWG